MSEYNNSSVSGSACSYAKLSNYNNGNQGMRPPIPASNVSGVYIVPDYSAPGYNTLTPAGHGTVPSCSGYYDIQTAYGANAGSCSTKYVQRLCQ